MTKNYIALIAKELLYKILDFGYAHIPIAKLIYKEKEDLREVKQELEDQLKLVSPFVYDEEFVFVEFELDIKIDYKKLAPKKEQSIKVENVINLYPLSEAGYTILKDRIAKNVNLKKPDPFLVSLVELRKKITRKHDAIKGAQVICKLFKFEYENFKKLNLNIEKIIDLKIRNIKSYDETQEHIFIHTLIYNRFNNYPQSDYGFLFDFNEIYGNSIGLKFFEHKPNSYFKNLQKNLKNNISIVEIIEDFDKKDYNKKFDAELKDNTHQIQNTTVILFFLKFKNLISTNKNWLNEMNGILKVISQKNKVEFMYAVYLSGIFFGFDKFRDEYYYSLNNGLFNNQNSNEKNISRQAFIAKEESKAIKNIELEFIHKMTTIESLSNSIDVTKLDSFFSTLSKKNKIYGTEIAKRYEEKIKPKISSLNTINQFAEKLQSQLKSDKVKGVGEKTIEKIIIELKKFYDH